MQLLKVNFYAVGEDPLADAYLVEKKLKALGDVKSQRDGDISQFYLRTTLSIEAVREFTAKVPVRGRIEVNPSEEDVPNGMQRV